MTINKTETTERLIEEEDVLNYFLETLDDDDEIIEFRSILQEKELNNGVYINPVKINICTKNGVIIEFYNYIGLDESTDEDVKFAILNELYDQLISQQLISRLTNAGYELDYTKEEFQPSIDNTLISTDGIPKKKTLRDRLLQK